MQGTPGLLVIHLRYKARTGIPFRGLKKILEPGARITPSNWTTKQSKPFSVVLKGSNFRHTVTVAVLEFLVFGTGLLDSLCGWRVGAKPGREAVACGGRLCEVVSY